MGGGSSVVEHLLAKERVAGSSPVRRSKKTPTSVGVFLCIYAMLPLILCSVEELS